MAKRKAKKANNLPLALIGAGLFIFFLGTFTHFNIYSNYLISQQEKPSLVQSADIPVALSIPEVGLNTPVVEGGIKSGQWILSNTASLYLPTSGRVGEGYNTIIYAHNTSNLFAKLKDVQIGESIYLKDKSGKSFEYQIFEKKDVNPYDLKSLYSVDKNIVTLFTCDGWFDSQRLLVRGKLIR